MTPTATKLEPGEPRRIREIDLMSIAELFEALDTVNECSDLTLVLDKTGTLTRATDDVPAVKAALIAELANRLSPPVPVALRVGFQDGKSPRERELEDLLTSARAIAGRKGENTAWDAFDRRVASFGIGNITPREFRDPLENRIGLAAAAEVGRQMREHEDATFAKVLGVKTESAPGAPRAPAYAQVKARKRFLMETNEGNAVRFRDLDSYQLYKLRPGDTFEVTLDATLEQKPQRTIQECVRDAAAQLPKSPDYSASNWTPEANSFSAARLKWELPDRVRIVVLGVRRRWFGLHFATLQVFFVRGRNEQHVLLRDIPVGCAMNIDIRPDRIAVGA